MSIFQVGVYSPRENRFRNILPGLATGAPTTYDAIIAQFTPDLVSYWKFQGDGIDHEGTQNATINGTPETNVETIVDLDRVAEGAATDGTVIAWPGTIGEYAQAAHNAVHKTAAGTIIVTHQHDDLAEKSTLVAADANSAAGGMSVEININGSGRFFIRNLSGVPVTLGGTAGDVQLHRAYTTIAKWGSPGMALTLYDDTGEIIRRVTNIDASALSGTSPIRFGAWHTDTSHHNGPYGRVVWLDRRLSDLEESQLARARTIIHDEGAEPSITDRPFFGLAIGDDLANCGPNNSNLTGGNPDNTQSEFFWAERTGVVTHLRHQWRMDSSQPGAYSAGNGGTYTVQIRPASGSTKRPIAGSSPVCQFTGYQPGNSSTAGVWIVHQFTLQGTLTIGQPYCLVYVNTATSPSANYVSSNLTLHSRGSFSTPPSGGWTPINIPSGEDHKPYPCMVQFPPNLQPTKCGMGHWNIRYADGQWTGCSNPATMSVPRSYAVQGTNMIRHRFRPWRNHTVDGVWINVQRRNASAGSLVATLESGPASATSGNGTTIEQVSIAASQLLDIGANLELEDGHQAYFSFIPFAQQRPLVSGTIYTIRLSASGGLDGRQNAGFRLQGSASDDWSPAFDDFAAHETGQTLSWTAWEYSLGLQISTNSGSTWSFPTGTNRQTCPLMLRCVT